MTAKLTKLNLRTTIARLESLRPPGPRPLTAEELVEVNALIEKYRALHESVKAAPERGELVFEWRVPREWALTLNAYAHKKGWQKKKLRQELDDAIRALLPQFPKALTHGSQQRRWLRATRLSTKVVDDVSVDVVGAKMSTDALVRCGVLFDDDAKHLIREARSEKTKPGNTHLLMEVFLVTKEGVAPAEPTDTTIKQIERPLGMMTRAIVGGGR